MIALTEDALRRIYERLEVPDFRDSGLVCKTWRSAQSEVMKEAVRRITFTSALWGSQDDEKGSEWASWPWQKAFRDMTNFHRVYPDVKLALVRVPNLSISMMELAAKKVAKVGFSVYNRHVQMEFGTQKEKGPKWVLISALLPDSNNLPYETQVEIIQKLPDWQVPSLRNTVGCLFAQMLAEQPPFVSEYTRCRELLGSDRTAVGLTSKGVAVCISIHETREFGILGHGPSVLYYPNSQGEDLGIAAMREY